MEETIFDPVDPLIMYDPLLFQAFQGKHGNVSVNSVGQFNQQDRPTHGVWWILFTRWFEDPV